MADWGWGFTSPQPLPNPIIQSQKGNFQLQKKETEVSLRLTNFVLSISIINYLGAKVANFRLTPKENKEKIIIPQSLQ